VLAGFAIAALLVLRALPTTLGWFVAAQVGAGLADGVGDVGMNVVAVDVDARTRRPIVNRLHAVWSLGALGGGLVGTLLATADASSTVHLLAAGALVAAVNRGAVGLAHEDRSTPTARADGPSVRWRSSRTLVALAVMGIAMSVLEGAPLEWGVLFLTDELDARSGVAAVAPVSFTLGMVAARLRADDLVYRYGVPAVLRIGAAAAAAALVFALGFDHVAVVLGAWAVVGAGVAACYPALFVAAGRAPGLAPGAGIGAISGIARTGFLLGPAFIGAIADATTLRIALTVPVVAAAIVFALAEAARRPDPPAR
jgi:hypothetical protein